MAHCRITIIGTEEQYDKVYDYLMEKENPGYFEDVRNGMDEMYAFYKWGSFTSIGGSDWVKVERTNVTKQEYVDNDLTKYIENEFMPDIVIISYDYHIPLHTQKALC